MSSGSEIHCSRYCIIVCVKCNTVKRIADCSGILTGLGHALTFNFRTLIGSRCAACAVAGRTTAGRAAATNSNIKLINISPSAALITFYVKCCLIHETHLHSHTLPSLKVLSYGNGTAGTLTLAYTPVLLEGGVTVDGRLIYTSGLVYIIGCTVYGNGSLRGCSRRTPGSPTVYNVVLYERISTPSVYTEVRISVRLVVYTIAYRNVAKLRVGLCTIPLHALSE